MIHRVCSLLGRAVMRRNYGLMDTNTAVTKDVILFKYENSRHYKLLNIFAFVQFGFWTYLSHFAFTCLRDAPAKKEVPSTELAWWRRINLGEQKYRNTITFCTFFIGYCFLVGAWTYTLRSVRYLVLRKGGNAVSFVTYTPFGKNRIIEVPLNKISAVESRSQAKVQLPIKVEGHRFYYVLDMQGEFLNSRLFDLTAGLNRHLKR